MRVADYLFARVRDEGVTSVFLVPGGGAMYLVDAAAAQATAAGYTYTVAAMLDSPLWINVAPFDPSVPSLLDQCQLAYTLFNASSVISPACLLTFSSTPY